MTPIELEDIVREFVAETRENLDLFEAAMLEAEKDMSPSALELAAMFRSVHSIKGSCGFLGFSRLEGVAHAAESLLAALRDRSIELDGRRVTPLLAMVDDIRALVDGIEKDGTEPEVDTSSTIAALVRATRGAADRGATGARTAPADADPNDGIREDAFERAGAGASTGGKIRVDVELLDRLMNLVGELVLARNQVLQAGGISSLAASAGPVQRLNLVTTELQETVVKTRMQPIGNVWSRFPRVVRELAVATGKRVRLSMDGRDTELDKSVIEAIQDPLIHLLRNAVDHGIELPSTRRAAGKPEEATLLLRAFHEGGMVNLELADDGAGIDVQKIRGRAVHLGLRTPEQAARTSDREALRLLFLPGFTTSDAITRVSGRGVGMDVVRANIEGIGGAVDVQTTLGVGTSIRIKIPLTLAIIPALIVLSGGTRYAIPQASVVEVVRVEAGHASRTIELIQGAPVLHLRGKLLPLAFLRTELGGATPPVDTASVAIVVLQADERSFGLVVDDIRDTEEIVVKPLWKRLKNLTHYAGATVMGDGRVALILDSMGLGQRVGVISDTRQAVTMARNGAVPSESSPVAEEMALLCRLGNAGRLAIPLATVARLEEIPRARVERVGGEMVTQYRGEILRLRPIAELLAERRAKPRDDDGPAATESDVLSVVVFRGEPPLGLVVDGILDIVPIPVERSALGARPGIAATLVVDGRITEVLDVDPLLRLRTPHITPAPPFTRSESHGAMP